MEGGVCGRVVERNRLNGTNFPRSTFEAGGNNSIEKKIENLAATIKWWWTMAGRKSRPRRTR